MTGMSEPRTEAGRTLLEEWFPGGGHGLGIAEMEEFRDAICAIEAEAAALAAEPDDGLDVERLARAITESSLTPYRSGVDYGAGRPIEYRFLQTPERDWLLAEAAVIAREYAALDAKP